ncbi:MAG: sugar transferase [Deltaproteobacteria bacterium]|nr:sugar transferase [Deltaproteobacteria bacterium]
MSLLSCEPKKREIYGFDRRLAAIALRLKVTNMILFLGFALIWHALFSRFGLYHSRRLSTRQAEVIDAITATSLGTLVLFLMSVIFHIQLATPLFLFFFWVYTSGTTILTRLILKHALEHLRAGGKNLHNVLIVGTNHRALQFAKKIDSRLELGYHILGFVDNQWVGTEKFLESGYPLVANFSTLPAFLRDNVVDEVVIDLPVESLHDEIRHIISQCIEQGVVVRFISYNYLFLRKVPAHAKIDLLEDTILVSLRAGAIGEWQVRAKRVFDFVVSLLLLVGLSPLLLLIALVTKFTSPGPVWFVQERVGLNKRRFRMYKFRTMVSNAEQKQAELEALNEASGPVFKLKNDPRITTVGRFLRKTSLDELPQIVNVLKGDMSLVGPRPLPVRDYNGFNTDWHRRRFSVRPGITCLWQVEGRSSIPFETWMQLDMKYIDHWSFGLDLKILAKTVIAIFKETGAY